MVELLQIHLITVHTIKGVAKPSVIIERIGAQMQKRKIAPTPPENFDSMFFSLIKFILAVFLKFRKLFKKEAIASTRKR